MKGIAQRDKMLFCKVQRTKLPKQLHMGVCINGGTPKWMVYNGKPY